MRRIAFTCLCLVLSGCGYNTWWNPPFTSGSNPNFPAGDSENMRRVVGEQVDLPALTTEPGDIWPGPLQPEPTLQDIERQGSSPRLSNRCPVRRNSGNGGPICRRPPRAAAVRRRPGPTSRA